MCGLLGMIATGARQEENLSVSAAQVAHALRLMQHRGPDGAYLTFFSACQTPQTIQRDAATMDTIPPFQAALGHNRLAIIDLSETAAQPMQRGQNWLVYNGELYNYRELRAELQAQGHSFKSESDSEVLLALYEYYGPEKIEAFLNRLNGMFAFAIWDSQRGRLFLARDRYGIKPLYYAHTPDRSFVFASEIKSLLALGVDKTLNYQALSEHLTFQTTLAGSTMLQQVHALEPGHYGFLDATSGRFQPKSYWQPSFSETSPLSEKEQTEAFRHALEQAVQSQLVGEVPIGSFLSGGLDTGAITAITRQQVPNLHTFTAGFDTRGFQAHEAHFDERIEARELADLLQTRHHELLISSTAMADTLHQVVWHLDDFRAGISYQNFLVSAMVREFVPVAMSGVGGDELLAGYPWRYEPVLLFKSTDDPAFRAQYYQSWVRLLSEEQKKSLFTPAVNAQLTGFSTQSSFDAVWQNCQADGPLNRALCFDFKTFLPALLTVEDRLSMAHSVESRVPFLDNALVDLCLALPAQSKLHSTTPGDPPIAKWILKQAMQGALPDAVLHRRKQGFTPPDATWYRTIHRQFIEGFLLSPRALKRGIFQPAALKNLLDAHWNGQANHRFLIWSLLCLESWHQQFIDTPVLTPPYTTAQ